MMIHDPRSGMSIFVVGNTSFPGTLTRERFHAEFGYETGLERGIGLIGMLFEMPN